MQQDPLVHTQQIRYSHKFLSGLLGLARESEDSATARPRDSSSTHLNPDMCTMRAVLWNIRFRSLLWVELLTVQAYNSNPV